MDICMESAAGVPMDVRLLRNVICVMTAYSWQVLLMEDTHK